MMHDVVRRSHADEGGLFGPLPSMQTLFALAQRKGLVTEADRKAFDKLDYGLAFAAIDPDAYCIVMHERLDQIGVPGGNGRIFLQSVVSEVFAKRLKEAKEN